MSSPVAKITDYQQRLRDDMLSQLYGDPVHEAIADAIALEDQRFEDVAHDVLEKILLENAVGDILDIKGKVARVQRLGRSDDDYRKIIEVAGASRDSDGGAEQITWIATQLVGADVRYTQEGTRFFTLQYESDTPMSVDLQAEALVLIGKAVSAGVAWRLIFGAATNTGKYDADTYGAARYGTRIGGSP